MRQQKTEVVLTWQLCGAQRESERETDRSATFHGEV